MGYTDSLAHYYDLSTPVALPDLGVVGGNPGTGANIASNPVGIHGKSVCAEFNGTDSNYNLGDVTMLNEVSAFTIAFWMTQDVVTASDFLFSKAVDASNDIVIETAVGTFYFSVGNGAHAYGTFVYGALIPAGSWHHIAMVFDGSQTGDANRLKVYVDAALQTLVYNLAVPATTADLSGQDATIGRATGTFDGLLDAFAIFSCPLTQLQVADFRKMTMQGRL